MKSILFIIALLNILSSCSNKSNEQQGQIVDRIQTQKAQPTDEVEQLTTTNDDQIIEYSELNSDSNQIPPAGKYRFDIAFAEWQGKSMGEKVTVIIYRDSIKVVYEGDGNLSLTEKGEIMDEGQIMKHKSGDWIIGTNSSDKELDEVGGCTGGPAVIDFKHKKYCLC